MRALLVLCLLAALLCGGRAQAHAQLVAADPAAGAIVAEAPASAALVFSEPVRALAFRWFPPAGAVPVEAAPQPAGERVVVPLPADPARGTWLLSWRVASADGHPIGGSLIFSIGEATGAAEAPGGGSSRAAAIGRGLLTLALVLGAGGAVFLRLVDRGPPGRLALGVARGSAAAALPLAGVALGLHGLDLLGLGTGGLLTGAPWRAALASPFAAMVAAALLASAAALVALRTAGPSGRALAGLAWALAALSFALFGHAATAPPRWLTAPAVALHAAAFLFWIGALPGLAERAARPGGALVPTLRRFSAIAVPLVGLVVLSGATLAVVQLRAPAALVETAYGRLLLAKLAAVALLLGLAALNRLRLTPAIERGTPGAAAGFRRSVVAEILLGLVILGLASGFRLTPPPRAIAAAASEAYAHLHGPTAMAEVRLRPGRPGPNRIEIGLATPEGEDVDPLEVRIVFSDPARGIEPIRVDAARDGPIWRAGPVALPAGGHWSVRLEVLISDFAKATLEADMTVPGP